MRRRAARLPFWIAVAVAVVVAVGGARPVRADDDPVHQSPRSALFNTAAHQQFIQSLPPQQRGRALRLKARVVVPGADPAVANAPDPQHVYFQCTAILSAEDRAALANQGIAIRQYLTNNTYVAYCQPGAVQAVTNDPLVAGVASIQPEDKIPGSIALQAFGLSPVTDDPLAVDGHRRYRLLVYSGVIAGECAAELNALGIATTEVDHGGDVALEADLTTDEVLAAAAVDGVAAIDYADAPRAVYNENSRVLNRAEEAGESPFNLTGAGVRVLIRDTDWPAHGDYNRRTRTLERFGPFPASHHTHVTGTVAGNGSGDRRGRGMAPRARIVTNEFFFGLDTPEIRDPFLNNAAQVSNHSYGFIPGFLTMGDYNVNANEWDGLVFTYDVIPVLAAGNSRFDPGFTYNEISGMQLGKNVITVGAIDHDDTMSTFSSFGPPEDGRVKPDVVNDGVALWSTLPDNTYGSFSGTSMAAPSTTGCLALFIQHYKNTVGGGTRPTAAEAKVCLIHGARDLQPGDGDPGGPGPFYTVGPDYASGFGVVDIVRTLEVLPNLVKGTVAQGATATFPIVLATPSPQLKATLVWTDQPGSTIVAPAIVTNLDLSITAPGPATVFPWSLDGNNPANPATTAGPNNVDTVEQVVINNAPAGAYVVNVAGVIVPASPHPFALVITTAIPATGVRVTTDLPSGTRTGPPVIVSAQGLGGTGDYEYQFTLNGPASGGIPQVVQAYSSDRTWEFDTTIAIGDHVITVDVRNRGSGSPSEASTAIFHTVGRALGIRRLTLTSNPANPQIVGTTVTWTVAVLRGGNGMQEYEFWLRGPRTGGAWVVMQPYGPANTFVWDTTGTTGVHRVRVRARNPLNLAVTHEAQRVRRFRVQPLNLTVTATPPSPQMPTVPARVNPITFTAVAIGGAGGYEYEFWLRGPSTAGAWVMVQANGVGDSWVWDTTGVLGKHRVRVFARHVVSPAASEARRITVFKVRPVPKVANAALAVAPVSPQNAGVPITWTAGGAGGLGLYEFEFAFKGPDTAGVWVTTQAYGGGNVWLWDTTGVTPGTYNVRVRVRNQGSIAAVEAGAARKFKVRPPP